MTTRLVKRSQIHKSPLVKDLCEQYKKITHDQKMVAHYALAKDRYRKYFLLIFCAPCNNSKKLSFLTLLHTYVTMKHCVTCLSHI